MRPIESSPSVLFVSPLTRGRLGVHGHARVSYAVEKKGVEDLTADHLTKAFLCGFGLHVPEPWIQTVDIPARILRIIICPVATHLIAVHVSRKAAHPLCGRERDAVLWDLRNEPRRHSVKTNMQFFLCARHRNIHQSPFFFKGVLVVNRADVREEPFCGARNEHVFKFKPFREMDGHQVYFIFSFLVAGAPSLFLPVRFVVHGLQKAYFLK